MTSSNLPARPMRKPTGVDPAGQARGNRGGLLDSGLRKQIP